MRPQIHFTPATGWMNDPIGITARNGQYDAFFQYVPGQTEWAPGCQWGHAIGPDLLSLEQRPVALAPGAGDDGIWTGCIIDAARRATAFYTSVTQPDLAIGRIRTAQPVDTTWLDWVKGDVVVEAPPHLDLLAFRDPFIYRDGERWRMFVGAGGRDGTAMALTYSSSDLTSWAYDGVAAARHRSEREPVWLGSMWECRQVFDLDGRTIMVMSVWDENRLYYAGYAVGSLMDGAFTADNWGQLSWGESLYAPSLFRDVDGQFALVFWLRGTTWTGALSVPYRLSLNGHRLVARPHPDVAARRGHPLSEGNVPGTVADIEWHSDAGTVAISSHGTTLMTINRAQTSLAVTVNGETTALPVDGTVRVIVDGPIIEVSSDAAIFATAVAPSRDGLHVSASAGMLDVYELKGTP